MEIAGVVAWLQLHGFAVARVTRGKTAIEFSGNAGNDAKPSTPKCTLRSSTGKRASKCDPELPAALAPLIAGSTPMNDFRPNPNPEVLGKALYKPRTQEVRPQWTSSTNTLMLAPGDFPTQYNLKPLYSSGIDGSGVTIGMIGASNVYPEVVAAYRSLFGLPAGTLNVIIDGSDPSPSAAIDRGNRYFERKGSDVTLRPHKSKSGLACYVKIWRI